MVLMSQVLDDFLIKVGADTSGAVKDIKAVSKSLQNLRNTFKTLNTTKAELRDVYLSLKDISSLDFSKVEASLAHLATIISNLNKFSDKSVVDAMKSLTTETTAKETVVDSEIGNEAKGIEELANATRENVTASLLNEKQQEKLAKALEKVNNELNPEQIKEVSNSLNEMGYSAEQTQKILRSMGAVSEEADKNIADSLDKVGKNATRGASKFSKLLASIKRIALYRAIRRAIQIIVNAIKEGILAITQLDEETNKSLSAIKSSWETLKASLGSIASPIIKLLQPAVTQLLGNITQLSNKLAELFAFMNGQDTFLKAKEQAIDFADSLNKAKKATLGIDELNILSEEDDTKKYEETAVSLKKEIGDLLLDFKKSVGSVWEMLMNTISQVAPMIGDLVEIVLPVVTLIGDIIAELEPVIKRIVSFVSKLVPVIGNIVDFLKQLIRSIVPPILTMVEKLLALLSPVVDLLTGIINIALKAITKIMTPIIEMVSIVLDALGEVFLILEPIFTALNDIFSEFTGISGETDFLSTTLRALVPVIKQIGYLLKGVAFIVLSVATGLSYAVETIVNMVKTVKDIFTGNWGNIGNDWNYNVSNKLASSVASMYEGLHSEGMSFSTGGFPEDGLFYANHGELVGQFSNGQTAVANNEQIIEGIKQGVMEAMQQSGGANVAVYLDSKQIASKVIERQNNRGALIITGGTLSYGK